MPFLSLLISALIWAIMASLSIFGPASGSGFSRVDKGWTFSTFGASGGFPNLPGVFAAIVSRASSAYWRMTFGFHLPRYGPALPYVLQSPRSPRRVAGDLHAEKLDPVLN